MYDMKNMEKLKTITQNAPESMKAFWAFNSAACADGAIPKKYKELMAIAIAVTTQCPYCIEIHTADARKAGATDAEIAEAIVVAMALRAGGALTHGSHCFHAASNG
ncbi:carboxymuconolactone decarboxylase family protein [Tuwongella immobilis]|uniref:Carboxymuconolactone decarboxylase-like domain-containing protein n=1 Tax=Tuwongella immobilis TaxID=692036 RepID=A0A6C2YL67_9BACT|nr:carboxymuconolactone decarboxylase family protein [Tuwongella immobilis]VIP02051.1 alkylhydroperoxidase : Alkyl hydroperoxide reductase AhpD OS=Beijerinckia indica subsp. indica (strain ATCC 9039 / DSM 1715 / NCIB 8712) GN=Bind_1265 PE=4 SV=1: CMD [Tuwongella immobilis]VTS00240.1 alkylhydroperoxidase : Alkyl hydroperoxide reductase AhpD OS=Beijerinckia indica subsp. indica (strain ATCC 9039 / DSM 1715 / NCIB 8712) GN=Bind_1265 PE=4 SV=1: CMD [Tuwongella immobilis]